MERKQILRSAAGAFAIAGLMFSVALAETTGFSDVPSSHPNYSAIMDLKTKGIISGYPDGTFKPEQVVNRVEALKIILLGSSVTVPDASGTAEFSDTSANEWYAKYLIKAKSLQIVGGYPDGTFKPTQTVNLVENLKMLINTKGISLANITVNENPYTDAMKDQWYAKYVQYAKNMQWLTPDSKNMIFPSQGMTRAKLAQLLYNSMKTQETPTTPSPVPTPTQQPSIDQPLPDMNISIESSGFRKDAMTIAIGTKVRWTNKDNVAHTVTSDDGKFDSGSIAPGQFFEFTFNEKNTFNYHCTFHPSMKGSITAKPAIEVPTV